MQRLFTLAMMAVLFPFLMNCGGGSTNQSENGESSEVPGKAEVKEEQPAEESTEDLLANKGIGPVTEVTLGELDQELANQGELLFNSICIACHRLETKFIGPAPKGILKRRSPEWIMNMMLNPDVMIKEDPIAKKLLVEYNNAPMANQNLTEDQARSILEFFRTLPE